MSKRTANCRATLFVLCLLLSAACRPEDFQIERLASPSPTELAFADDWQQRCYYSAWPAAWPVSPAVPSPFPPEWHLQFDDPAMQAYIETLVLALCAPTQPYRATLTTWVDSPPRAMTYIIDVVSAQHYSVQSVSNPTCIHQGGQAYAIMDGQWQEMKAIDTMPCDNPLQAVFLPLLPFGPQQPLQQGRLVAAQQQIAAGGRVKVYTFEFTTASYPVTETFTQPAARIVYHVWIDAEAEQPMRIVSPVRAGAMPSFAIDLTYEITPFLGLPPLPNNEWLKYTCAGAMQAPYFAFTVEPGLQRQSPKDMRSKTF